MNFEHLSNSEVKQDLYEYSFARAVRDLNATMPSEMRVPLTHAEHYHDKLVEQLPRHANGQTAWGAVTSQDFKAAMDKAFEGYGDRPVSEYLDQGRGQHGYTNRYQADWMKTVGLQRENGGQDPAQWSVDARVISPFSQAYRRRQSVMDMPFQTQYLTRQDYKIAYDMARPRQDGKKYDTDILQDAVIRMEDKASGGFEEKSDRRLVTGEDLSGVSRLRPFMSKEDYKSVRDKASRPFAGHYMGQDAQRRAEDFMRNAAQDGVRFRFYTTHVPGQLEAEAENGLTIRIMDAKSQAYAANSIRSKSGLRGLIRSTELESGEPYIDKDTGRQKTSWRQNTATNACTGRDVYEMFRYMSGQSASRPDGRPLGEMGTHPMDAGRKGCRDWNMAYHTSPKKNSPDAPFVADIGPLGKNPTGPHKEMYLRSDRKAPIEPLYRADVARVKLTEWYKGAREYAEKELDVDNLIEFARLNGHNPSAAPQFTDASTKFNNAQTMVYSYLTGRHGDGPLPRPGTEKHNFDTTDSDVMDDDGDVEEIAGRTEFYPEDMPREEQARAYMRDLVDQEIGTMEFADDGLVKVDEEGRLEPDSMKINPDGIVQYSNTVGGVLSRKEDLKTMLRSLEAVPEHIKGAASLNTEYADSLRRFDPETAVSMSSHEDPFMRDMAHEIQEAARVNGAKVKPDDILIDGQGIVQFFGEKQMTKENATMKAFTGNLGPIYAPDQNGAILVRHELGDDKLVAMTRVVDLERQKPGEDLRPDERYVVSNDYASSLKQGIRAVVSQGMMRTQDQFGSGDNLSQYYRHLYGEEHKGDFYQEAESRGVDPAHTDAIIRHEASRITPAAWIQENYSQSAMARKGDEDLDDLHGFTQYEPRGVALAMDADFGAHTKLVDPMVTSTGQNLGWHMYLREGTSVDASGHFRPAADSESMSPLTNELARQGRYNPDGGKDAYDRFSMTVSAAAQNYTTQAPVNIAQFNAGHTFEDCIVMTSDMAGSLHVPDHDNPGQYRTLKTGDKAQLHGNKGVVVVIDTGMTDEQAAARGQDQLLQVFKDNNKDGKRLDVIISAYSSVSRFNAGQFEEAQHHGGQQDLAINGEVHPGAIFKSYLDIMPKQAVDKKTVDYTQSDSKSGRSYGAQLNMALSALGCEETISGAFQDNKAAYLKTREALITCGMDIGPDGTMYLGYHPQPGEERRRFDVPTPQYRQAGGKKASAPEFDERAVRQEFAKAIADKGGIMELPFELKYQAPRDRSGSLTAQPMGLQPIDQDSRSDASRAAYGGQTYAMHVAPANFRNDKDMSDGTVSYSNYTRHLESIYVSAAEWLDADRRGDAAKKKEIETEAQSTFDKLQSDTSDKYFEGKHNVFRSALMSAKQPDSATAVWTADPNLDVDKINIGEDLAKGLGVKENDWIAMHRDPALQDSAIWFVQIRDVDKDLTGVSVNPMGIPGQMDGDFDGDSVGLVKINSPQAQAEMQRKASVANRLLDDSKIDKDTGERELVVASGQDVAAGWAADPSLKSRYESIRHDVNNTADAFAAGAIAEKDFLGANQQHVRDVSDYLRDVTRAGFGRHVIQYGDAESHIRSIEAFTRDGAKGSSGKVDEYASYMGVHVQRDKDKNITGVETAGKCLATEEQMQGIPLAKRTQVEFTGMAGQKNIDAMAVAWGQCPKEALRLQKLLTQGVLQVKHDAQQAATFRRIMTGPMEQLWSGNKLEMYEHSWQQDMSDAMSKSEGRPQWMKDETTGSMRVMQPEDYKAAFVRQYGSESFKDWRAVQGPDGKSQRAGKDDFRKSFNQIYGKEGLGFSVNQKLLDRMADVMADKTTGLIRGLKDQARKEDAVPMIRAAYAQKGQGFAAVHALASEEANLYTGKSESGIQVKAFEAMAPREVKANIAIARQNEVAREMGGEVQPMRAVLNKGAVETGTYMSQYSDREIREAVQKMGQYQKDAGTTELDLQEKLYTDLHSQYVSKDGGASREALDSMKSAFAASHDGAEMTAADMKRANQDLIEDLRSHNSVSLSNLAQNVPQALSVIEDTDGRSITARWSAAIRDDRKATVYDVLNESELGRAQREARNYDGNTIARTGSDGHLRPMQSMDELREADVRTALDAIQKSGGAKLSAIEGLETGRGKIDGGDKLAGAQAMKKLMDGAKASVLEAARPDGSSLGYDDIRMKNVAAAFDASTSSREKSRTVLPNDKVVYQDTGRMLDQDGYARQMQDIAKDFGVHLTDRESDALAQAALEANRQFMERRKAVQAQPQPSGQPGFDPSKAAPPREDIHDGAGKNAGRPLSEVGERVLQQAEEDRKAREAEALNPKKNTGDAGE